ncbi:MAG: lyase family protein [Arhodomonas sp.]|nr:lyase family protein [Arhodomonas sp.]
MERGEFPWSPSLEDVHMNIEARLTERIGDAGKRMHTARSRNDQIATDVRLWLREAIDEAIALLRRFQSGLVELAEREAETIMPGFTHLQVAQPITFGHHMLAWYEMLVRDEGRLADCRERANVMPPGLRRAGGHHLPVRPRRHDLLASSLRLRRRQPQLLDGGSPTATSPSSSLRGATAS